MTDEAKRELALECLRKAKPDWDWSLESVGAFRCLMSGVWRTNAQDSWGRKAQRAYDAALAAADRAGEETGAVSPKVEAPPEPAAPLEPAGMEAPSDTAGDNARGEFHGLLDARIAAVSDDVRRARMRDDLDSRIDRYQAARKARRQWPMGGVPTGAEPGRAWG